jgi:hypothetical protein
LERLKGINLLGFKHCYYYTISKKNKRKILRNKISLLIEEYYKTKDYDGFMHGMASIFAHLEHANTFNLRKNLVNKLNFYLIN